MSLVKALVIIAALLPLVWTIIRIFLLGGSANPIQEALHNSGDWALIFLLLSLSITPIRRIFNLQKIKPFRRSFGLFSCFYATLHLAVYIGLEQFFDWPIILDDMINHKRIIVGLVCYFILIILAITSFKTMIRKMGVKRWKRLHRTSYLAAITAVLHYYWLVKSDVFMPLVSAAILFLLLAYRVVAVSILAKPGLSRESGGETGRR